MKISKELKVGALGLLALTLFVLGMNYLKGLSMFSKNRVFYTYFDDSKGLLRGASLYLNGFGIGKVTNMELDSKTRKIKIQVTVGEKVDIPKDSKIVLFSEGVMGPTSLKVKLGESATFIQEEGVLGSELEGTLMENVQTQIDPIKMQVEILSKQLNQIARWANYTLDSTGSRNTIVNILNNADASVANVKGVSESFDDVIKRIDEAVISINQLIASTNRVVSNVDANKANINETMNSINRTMQNVEYISDSLAKATNEIRVLVEEVKGTLENISQITAGIQNGEGSVGKLLKDEGLYSNTTGAVEKLNIAIADVDSLLNEIKANPKKYLNVKVVVFERRPRKGEGTKD